MTHRPPRLRPPIALSTNRKAVQNTDMRRRTAIRILAWTALVAAASLTAAYAYLTHPRQLRARIARLTSALASPDSLRIGDVAFSPGDGLALANVELELRGTPAGPSANPPPSRVRIGSARLRCDFWSLLTGRVRLTQLELQGLDIELAYDAVEGLPNWWQREGDGDGGFTIHPAKLPRIDIQRADLRIMEQAKGAMHVRRRWVLAVHGMRNGNAYDLSIRPLAGSGRAPSPGGAPLPDYLAAVRFEPGTIRASMGWIDVELLSPLLPPHARGTVQRLNPSGLLRADNCTLANGKLVGADLAFSRLSLSIPIEDDEAGLRPNERFLQVTDAEGVVTVGPNGASESITDQVSGAQIRVNSTARLNGAPTAFTLDGRLLGRSGGGLRLGQYRATVAATELRLPEAPAHAAFLSAERLPRGVRSFLNQQQPRGCVNAEFEFSGDARSAPEADTRTTGRYNAVQFNGIIETLGVAFRSEHFPYDVHDVRGTIQLSNSGVRFAGLYGRHGSSRIRIDGGLHGLKMRPAFDLYFRSENLPLDGDLYAALPEQYQEFWQSTSPIGLCDVSTWVHRDDSDDEDHGPRPVTEINARLLTGGLTLGEDVRLERADGLITIARGRVDLHDLHGFVGDATVRINGSIQVQRDDQPRRVDVSVEACDYPIERSSTLRRDGRVTGEVRWTGVGDVWGAIHSVGPTREGDAKYVVQLKDGRLTSFDHADWMQTRGWVTTQGGRQELSGFTASQDGAWLEADGLLPSHGGFDAPGRLSIRAGGIAMERLLPAILPPGWLATCTSLGPMGEGRFSAELSNSLGSSGEPELSASFLLESAGARPTVFPLQLRDLTVSATVAGDGYRLERATASWADTVAIEASGCGGESDGAQWADLRVTTGAMETSPALVAGLPEALGDILRKLDARGRMRITLDAVHVDANTQPGWTVAGRVDFDPMSMQLGFDLTDASGRLTGRCAASGGCVELDGRFVIDHGRLQERPIERWEGRLSRHAGDDWIELADISGRMCDGEVRGRVRIHGSTGEYETSWDLENLDFDAFIHRSGAAVAGRNGSNGRLDGRVFVRGRGGDVQSRHGGGELRIRGGSLLSTPASESLLAASRQRNRAIGESVDRAELRFAWEGSELKFTQVDLNTRDLRLIGDGTWNLRTNMLDLTLVGVNPKDAPRIGLLTDLAELAGRELVQYRVVGDAARPKVSIEPLHGLTGTVRDLLRKN
jgi:hypothetical protein